MMTLVDIAELAKQSNAKLFWSSKDFFQYSFIACRHYFRSMVNFLLRNKIQS